MNWTETYERSSKNVDLTKYATLNMTRAQDTLSNRYSFVPTMDVVKYLGQEGWEPCQVKEGNVRQKANTGFQKHMVRFRHGELGLIDEDEGLFAELVLTGSHNGLSAIDIHVGLRRFTCTNTMSVSEGRTAAYKIKHVGDAYNQTMLAAHGVASSIPMLGESIKEFRSIQMTSLDKMAFAKSAVACKYDEDFLGTHHMDLLGLCRPKRYGDKGDSLWNTFNVIQEKLLNGGVKTLQTEGHVDIHGTFVAPRRNTSRVVKDVKEDVRLNKALWALTEYFAKEKRAMEV